jgi:membrane-bound serine protease (ClpP class)
VELADIALPRPRFWQRSVLLALFTVTGVATTGAPPPGPPRRAALIEFQGPIHTLSEQYLYRKLNQAEASNADLVIIEIDSPGGGIEPTLQIAERLRHLNWARTVAFVPREALSGAALFALACDEIILAPDAVFGDAGPIFMGEDFLFRHAPEKIRSDLALRVRDLAQSKGRPPALAEAMVDMDLVVFKVRDRDTGQITFMSDAEIKAEEKPDRWEKLNEVHGTREKHFLEVTGRQAVELNLADGLASDRNALRQRYQQLEEFRVLPWNTVDTAVLVLNHPLVTGLLFVVGLIALYVEFASPGIGLGGLIALVCFAVFFWSRFLGGTAEWLEVILFGAGVILLLVEVFVIPGFGIWGATGFLLLVTSLILASEPFLVPRTQRDLASLLRNVVIVLGSGALFSIIAMWLTSSIGKIPVLNRLALQPPTPEELLATSSTTSGSDSMLANDSLLKVGDTGVACSPLRPAGKVRFGQDYVDVVSDGTFINPGEQVRVVQVRGNRIVVRRVASDA